MNYENDAALGISATETTRNAKAMEMFGKKFKELNEYQKQDTLLRMVEDGNKASGVFGQAAREATGLENVTGNLNSIWNDLKATMLTPFLEPLTNGMVALNERMQDIDAEQIGSKLKSGFDTVMDVAVPTFNTLKTGFGWLMDNKDTIIAVGSGLAAGFATFKAIQIGKGIFDMVKGFSLIGSLTNPVGIAVVAIGGLVAAGVWLYKNWDTVKEKAGTLKENLSNAWQQIKDNVGGAIDQVGGFFTGLKEKAVGLWETIKQNPMELSVLGPIGLVIGAGMELYQNWDNIKLKAGELWTTTTEKFAGIKQSVSDFVQPAISWFESLGQKWDNFKSSLTNFKMPGWVTSIGDTIGGAFNKVKGFVNGSHATGLENVPFDGYKAELHRGETILTASQSNTLRGMGVLSANSDGTPNLYLGGIKGKTTPQSAPVASVEVTGTSPVNNNQNANVQVSVPIELIIQGNADDASIQKLLAMLPTEIKRVIEEIFREKLAGIGG